MQIGIAAQNISGDGLQTAVEDFNCSTDLTPRLHGHLTFLSVLNSFLSVTAFLGNALILMALHKESSLHPPSKLLLRKLATTDLCVGLISEPLFVSYCMWRQRGRVVRASDLKSVGHGFESRSDH